MSRKNENAPILFQNDSKRDAAMIKTFLSFVNRVKNPNSSLYLFVMGVAAMLMPVFTEQPIVSRVGFGIGVVLILLTFFRHYIPLTIMKRKDPDYIEGALISCRFFDKGFKVYRNEQEFIDVSEYRQLTGLYEDEKYFYLNVNNDDLLVLPKKAFVVGEWEGFKAFIAEKRALAFVWIPATFSNKLKELPGKVKGNLDAKHREQERRQKEILMKEQEKKAKRMQNKKR